jgi:hypothetical protein
MAQTAVEFLKEQYDKCPESFLTDDDFNKAKEIEKQQIIEAFTHEDNTTWNKELRTKAAEQYYDEKYGS